ncbi:dihydroorotate dehydrogenase electron transfer subunit [Clostridium ihumii]|uniref:dihydroorotate dehydrogenase electron transfer subunit n=1 Tax=Clostridium ihumii TaxID=1470356 RepID=UPI00054F764A|nr:dihydroorotate dehydrogenase electron transfer subunit [Clostridium ihumii]
MSTKKEYTINKVLSNKKICEGIYKLEVEGNFSANPGQFYMLRSWTNEPILGRPISIHNINEEGTIIEFLYAVVGQGTELLKNIKENDEINLMGPLGNGFDISEANKGKVAILAGGIGIAPMNYLAKSLDNENIDIFVGFRDEIYGLKDLDKEVKSINIATESGNVGHKGYITDIFNPKDYDLVLCCGPEVMMHKAIKMCRDSNTKIYVSEEKKMACGIGACLVCTCKTKKGNKRTCKDGPVFLGDDIEL